MAEQECPRQPQPQAILIPIPAQRKVQPQAQLQPLKLFCNVMNDIDRIREHITRMRTKGIEPDVIYMCYELWDSIGRKGKFAGVCVSPDSQIQGRFEVR